jgi:TetR/AcrR family transcriptional regulator, cholesterol catabolism regulator
MGTKPKAVPDFPEQNGDSRYERRLGEILRHATQVFYDKGYEGASMRDLSRATGMSLAGLYYYFESKEKLLYLIQKHTFETVLSDLRNKLEGLHDPEQKVRTFVQNHLEYFLANKEAMSVLSHEDDTLQNSYGQEVAKLKREYYLLCMNLVRELRANRGVESDGPAEDRIDVLSLFGMINWIYTWHNPRFDGNADDLARRMSDIFLRGILGPSAS